LQVARCARGEVGETPIRGGRRSVRLGPVGALTFVFGLAGGDGELPLARAVAETRSLDGAARALNALGVHTELEYERSRVANPPA
ncbi:MAG: DUF1152 domain-containing protein, partial [Solirubrobacterales bacterium]